MTTEISLEEAKRIHATIEEITGAGEGAVFMANHEHEGLPPGRWSFAYEGWTNEDPWSITMAWVLRELYPDRLFEPINGCILGVHPVVKRGA